MGVLKPNRRWDPATTTAARLSSDLVVAPGHGLMASTPAVWTGTHLRWADRILWLTAGRGPHWSETGYFQALMPAVGTVIPTAGGADPQTVTDQGIPIPSHYSLYFIPNINSGDSGSFLMVTHSLNNFVLPPHALLVASHTENTGVGGVVTALKTAWGDTLTPWRALPLVNGVAPYSGFPGEWSPRYRKINGVVYTEGLVNVPQAGTHFATMPVGFRPGSSIMRHLGSDGGAVRRIDFYPDGRVFASTEQVGAYASWQHVGASYLAEN